MPDRFVMVWPPTSLNMPVLENVLAPVISKFRFWMSNIALVDMVRLLVTFKVLFIN